jgi:hypothetical protein
LGDRCLGKLTAALDREFRAVDDRAVISDLVPHLLAADAVAGDAIEGAAAGAIHGDEVRMGRSGIGDHVAVALAALLELGGPGVVVLRLAGALGGGAVGHGEGLI